MSRRASVERLWRMGSILRAGMPKVRVRILLEGPRWQVWSRRLVEEVLRGGDVEITGVVEGPGAADDWRRLLLARFGAGSELAPCDAPPLFLSSQDADVTLYLGLSQGSPDGVWRFAFDGALPFFDAVEKQEPAAAFSLTGGSGRVLADTRIAVWQGVQIGFPLRDALRHAPRLALRAFAAFRQHGNGWLVACPGATASVPVAAPGPLRLGMFGAQGLLRSAGKRIRARGSDLGWYVALQAPGVRGFAEFPSTLMAADPWFAESEDGRLFLFYEEQADPSSKAHLNCVEILGPGEFGERRVILNTGSHLSYPAVVRDGSDWFLIPESSEDRTVDLYVAEEFPWRWRKVRSLLENVPLVDTTPYRKAEDGSWYFFTSTMIDESGCEAYLFRSSSIDGDWQWHPANPICSDIRRARGAGPIWRDDHGVLWRPGQDCSVRYGYAITWNEILRLDATHYEERESSRIEPDWTREGLGTHTISHAAGWEARDAMRWVPRKRF